jgi:hypothetical protein
MKTSLLSFIANKTFISCIMVLCLWEQRDLWRPHDQVVGHQLVWTGLGKEERKLQYSATLTAEGINTAVSVFM